MVLKEVNEFKLGLIIDKHFLNLSLARYFKKISLLCTQRCLIIYFALMIHRYIYTFSIFFGVTQIIQI